MTDKLEPNPEYHSRSAGQEYTATSGFSANGTSADTEVIPPADSFAKRAAQSPELVAFWEAVKRMPAYIRLATALAKDADVPNDAKVALGIGAAYAISPIDLVPGVIPVAGQLDDVYVLLTGLRSALKRTPDDVRARILASATVTEDDITRDLKAVRGVVKLGAKKAFTYGGRLVGRVGKASYRFGRDQLDRQRNRGTGVS